LAFVLAGPAQRQGIRPPDYSTRREAPDTFGPLERRDFVRILHDLGITGKLQQVAGFEIGKDKTGLAIGKDVTKRVEKQVTGEVRNAQDAIAADPNKARLAAPVRDIRLPLAALEVRVGGDEECVG
jgi:hypothetical protein